MDTSLADRLGRAVPADGHRGRELREYTRDYNRWTTIGVLDELLPHPDNRITLVIDADPRIWDVPKVILADGSVCPTQGAANPALTIMALASRLAERMADGAAMADGRPLRATHRLLPITRSRP